MPDQYGIASWRENHPTCHYAHNPLNRMRKTGNERLYLKRASKLWLNIMHSLELVDLSDHSNGRYITGYITMFTDLNNMMQDHNLAWADIVQVGLSIALRETEENHFEDPAIAGARLHDMTAITPGLVGLAARISLDNASGVCPCGSMHHVSEESDVVLLEDTWVDDLLD
ncbi:hypothetical protein TWF481_002642 [Arthrobotrys musiformis]|uniref:Uncharacterized protein n=1 Tax=Arthrobotrys musiformis TaxID=47236 RepID=A0AAV9VQY1_9PEZI